MFASVTPEEACRLLSEGAVAVVDVRDPGEFASGHLPGARSVTLAQLRSEPHGLLSDGLLFVCAGGVRSETAARFAAQHGYSRIYSLNGGTRSWLRAGFPVVQEELAIAV
jgi:rhodanese-related sulfurtransferase